MEKARRRHMGVLSGMEPPRSLHSILFVDDDVDTRDAAAASLRGWDRLLVHFVADGIAAGEILATRAHAFDLIILDSDMPGQAGLDILADLRRRGWTGTPPAVLFTNSSDPGLAARALGHGAVGCVEKPVPFTEFRSTLQAMVLQWFPTLEQA